MSLGARVFLLLVPLLTAAAAALAAMEKVSGGDPILVVNPAFWPGLEMT